MNAVQLGKVGAGSLPDDRGERGLQGSLCGMHVDQPSASRIDPLTKHALPTDARYTGQNPETLPLGAPVHWETREKAHRGGSLEAGSSTVFTKELFLAFRRMRISEADASLSKEESASECYHVCFLGPCRTIVGRPSSPFPHCWRLWLEQKTLKVGSGTMTLRRERCCRELDGWLLPLVWKTSGP